MTCILGKFAAVNTHGIDAGSGSQWPCQLRRRHLFQEVCSDDDDNVGIKIRIDGAADEKFGIGGSVGVDLKNDDYSAVD